MTAAEARSQLNHAGSVHPDPDLRVRRPVPDPERLRRGAGRLDRTLCFRNTRPGVRQRDPERRRVGGEAIGDEQRMEDAVDRDGLDGDLRAVDVLLDDVDTVPRGLDRRLDRGRKLLLGAHEREPALALAVGSLDDARRHRLLERLGLRHAGGGEALPLSRLGRHECGSRRVDRMRKPEPRCHPGGDADRPVGARRDDPVDALGAGQAVDARLVLRRDERPLVRVGEAGRRRIAIDRDHEQITLSRCAQEPDLRGPRS